MPSDLQRLLGDVAILPSVLEAVDLLPHLPCEQAVEKAREVKATLQDVFARLSKWPEWHAREEMNRICNPRHNQSLANSPAIDPSRWFTSLLTANLHTYLWTFRIICLTEMEKISSFLSGYGCCNDSDEGRWKEGVRAEVSKLAVHVCYSVEYLLQDRMKLYGPASALFPLQTAFEVLSKDWTVDRERITHCQKLFERIDSKGISIRPY